MRKVTVALLSLLAFAAPAGAQQGADAGPRPWNFTVLTGVGVREMDSDGYGAALVGFSGSRPRGERIELGVEAFVLLPNEKVFGPKPIFFFDDEGNRDNESREGTWQRSVDDIDVLVLVRMNYFWAPWRVRPYVGIGAGLHVKGRTRVFTRTSRELPDGEPETITRDSRESLLILATLFAAGLDIPITDRWSVRSEARLPIPAPYVTIETLGFAVGVSYVR